MVKESNDERTYVQDAFSDFHHENFGDFRYLICCDGDSLFPLLLFWIHYMYEYLIFSIVSCICMGCMHLLSYLSHHSHSHSPHLHQKKKKKKKTILKQILYI